MSDITSSIVAAHARSMLHRAEILASEQCGCFYCRRLFAPDEIQEWVDDGETALCPRCGIDSVIGSASGFPVTVEFLRRIKRAYF